MPYIEIMQLSNTRQDLLLLFKDGSVEAIREITGGGQLIGSGSPGYEVHVTLADGQPAVYLQAEIAAVLDLDQRTQVEFGNPRLASNPGDHPRMGIASLL